MEVSSLNIEEESVLFGMMSSFWADQERPIVYER
jgi:hypothetical protein